jgi:hypothetical protein
VAWEYAPVDEEIREWAVWSAWRGDLPLFTRVARAAVWELDSGVPLSCLIEVTVMGDLERFRSLTDFEEQVTPQALRAFASIRCCVRCGGTTVRFTLARRRSRHLEERDDWLEERDESGVVSAGGASRINSWVRRVKRWWSHPALVPGVLLEVESNDREREEVRRLRDAVANAAGRGTPRLSEWCHEWVRSPNTDRASALDALRECVKKRKGRILLVYTWLPAVLGVLIWMLAALGVPGLPDLDLATVFAVAYPFTLIGAFLYSPVGWKLSDLMFPAVEIAAQALNRRILALAGRAASLALAPVVGALTISALGLR